MASALRRPMSAMFGIYSAIAASSCSSETPELFPDDGDRGGNGGLEGIAGMGAGGAAAHPIAGAAGSIARAGAANGGTPGSSVAGASSGGKSMTSDGGMPGAGGASVTKECDDSNRCTVDALGEDGVCSFTPVRCAASAGGCVEATCEAATGTCVERTFEDGTACDDEDACTFGDQCTSGVCAGTADVTFGTEVERVIPDGLDDCGGIGQPLSVTWNVAEPGTVTAVTLTVELAHPFISDLEIALTHQPSGREAVVFHRLDAPGASFDGTYIFQDGATPLEAGMPAARVASGTFAPHDSLNGNLEDLPVSGTWALKVGDFCARDAGTLSSARVKIARACP